LWNLPAAFADSQAAKENNRWSKSRFVLARAEKPEQTEKTSAVGRLKKIMLYRVDK